MGKTDTFWAIRFPGLKSLPIAQMNREIARLRRTRPDIAEEEERELAAVDRLRAVLLAGPYPDLSAGHVDLYKAFGWRFLSLCRSEGHIGVVQPRSLLMSAGSAAWRVAAFAEGEFSDVTTLVNSSRWVFEDVHPQWTVGLISIRKHAGGMQYVHTRGPYASARAFTAGASRPAAQIPTAEFLSWSEGAAFPLLPTSESLTVYRKLKENPRLDSPQHPWRFRPVQGDFNSTSDKEHLVIGAKESRAGLWPVYGGRSFYLWDSDTGEYYAHAEPRHVQAELFRRRDRGSRNARSAFSELNRSLVADEQTLPCLWPRIIYRKITRATDTRTVIAILAPPRVIATTACPYLLRVRGSASDEAYLLGVLCSMPLDWCARRHVEVNLDFHILNALPIPLAGRNDLQRRVEQIAGRLAAVDDRYTDWAAEVGVPIGSVTSETVRDDLITELDAVVAHLYGLNRADVEHIFATFHRGWDYADRLAAVLVHYDRWAEQTGTAA